MRGREGQIGEDVSVDRQTSNSLVKEKEATLLAQAADGLSALTANCQMS